MSTKTTKKKRNSTKSTLSTTSVSTTTPITTPITSPNFNREEFLNSHSDNNKRINTESNKNTDVKSSLTNMYQHSIVEGWPKSSVSNIKEIHDTSLVNANLNNNSLSKYFNDEFSISNSHLINNKENDKEPKFKKSKTPPILEEDSQSRLIAKKWDIDEENSQRKTKKNKINNIHSSYKIENNKIKNIEINSDVKLKSGKEEGKATTKESQNLSNIFSNFMDDDDIVDVMDNEMDQPIQNNIEKTMPLKQIVDESTNITIKKEEYKNKPIKIEREVINTNNQENLENLNINTRINDNTKMILDTNTTNHILEQNTIINSTNNLDDLSDLNNNKLTYDNNNIIITNNRNSILKNIKQEVNNENQNKPIIKKINNEKKEGKFFFFF